MAIEGTIPVAWLAALAILGVLVGVFLGYIARKDSPDGPAWTPMDAKQEDLVSAVRARQKPRQEETKPGEVNGQDNAVTCLPVRRMREAHRGTVRKDDLQKKCG